MTFVAKYSLEQWAEARRLRAEGFAYRLIAERLGFAAASTVAKRAREEGWPAPAGARKPALKRTRAARSPTPPAARKRLSAATVRTRRTLATRLCSVFEIEIRMKELIMKQRLQSYRQAPHGVEPPVVTKDERESFAALIEQINQVTEMASEPALAADGRRKSATIDPELAALSDDLDAGALAAASEKDENRARLAQQLAKGVGPA